MRIYEDDLYSTHAAAVECTFNLKLYMLLCNIYLPYKYIWISKVCIYNAGIYTYTFFVDNIYIPVYIYIYICTYMFMC